MKEVTHRFSMTIQSYSGCLVDYNGFHPSLAPLIPVSTANPFSKFEPNKKPTKTTSIQNGYFAICPMMLHYHFNGDRMVS